MKQLFLLLLIVLCLILLNYEAKSAVRYSVAYNYWNLTATWSETQGGAPGASVPGAGDTAYIYEHVTTQSNNYVAALYIIGNEMEISDTLFVSGNVYTQNTIYGRETNSTLAISGKLFVTGSCMISGSWGTDIYVSDSIIINSGVTLTFRKGYLYANGPMSISGTYKTENYSPNYSYFNQRVTINSGGTFNTSSTQYVYFRNGITNNGGNNSTSFTASYLYFNTNNQTLDGNTQYNATSLVSVTGITLTNSGTFSSTSTATGVLSGTGTWLQGTNGVLKYRGSTLTVTGFDAATNANTVHYDRLGDHTVRATTYHNLEVSNSGTKTLAGNIIVNNNITLNVNSTLANAGYSISGFSGKSLTLGSGANYITTRTSSPFLPSNMTYDGNTSSTITYNGTGTYTLSDIPPAYMNVSFSPATATSITLPSAITVNTKLTIGDNATINDAGYTIHCKGNVENNGVIAGTGTLLLSGGSASHTITGSAGTYVNFELNDNFGASWSATIATTTVNGTFNITAGTLTLSGMTGGLNIMGTTSISGTMTGGSAVYSDLFTLNPGGVYSSGGTFKNGLVANGTYSGTSAVFSTNNQSITGASAVSFSNGVNVTGITVTNNVVVNMTYSAGIVLTGTGTWLQGTSSVLNYSGTSISGITLDATTNVNLVNYTTTAQTVYGVNYYNLTLTGSGSNTIKTLTTGTTNVLNNLTLSSVANATTVGSLTIGGNLLFNSGTLTLAGYDFTVNGSSTLTGTFNINSASGTKIFNGLITNNGIWNNSGNSAISIRNGLINNATFTSGSGIYTFESNSQAFSGTATIQNVSVPSGITLTNNGTLTASVSLNGAGTLVQGNNATLNIDFAGTAGITELTASATNNTVNYTKGAQTIIVPTASVYANLGLSHSNTATKTLSGTITLNKNLTISANITLANAGYNINVAGNLTNSGTHSGTGKIILTNGTGLHAIYAPANSTFGDLELDDSFGATLGSNGTVTLNNLEITKGTLTINYLHKTFTVSGTTTIGNSSSNASLKLAVANGNGIKTFTGLITIGANGTWNNAINEILYIKGGITNNGTFTAGSGVYTFQTNSQALNGTFVIPSIEVIGINLTNNDTLTVSTALTGTGALIQGSGSVLYFGAYSLSITTLTATAIPNLVEYNSLASQTVRAVNYDNLRFTGSGTKSVTSSITLTGDLFVGSTVTLSATNTINGQSGKTFTLSAGASFTTSTDGINCFPTNMTYDFDVASTVNINSTSNSTFDASMPTNFGNLIFIASNCTKTLPLSTPITIHGNLTTGSAHGIASNGNTVIVKGNLSLGGSFTGSGNITLTNGSAAHNFYVNAMVSNIILDDVYGAVLSGSSGVYSGTLTLTNGNILLGNYDLAVNSAGTISGTFDNTRMIVTNGTGKLKKYRSTGISSYTYPVGDITGVAEYTPVTLNFTANATAGYVGVGVTDNKHPNNANTDDYVTRYWTFTTATVTTYTYNATFTYTADDVVGLNESNYIIRFWRNSAWGADPGSLTNSGTHQITSGTLNNSTCPLNTTEFTSYIGDYIFYYWSKTSGNWNGANTWEYTTINEAPEVGEGYVTSSTPSSANCAGVTIRDTMNITVNASTYDIDQLTIEGGSTLTLNTYTLTINNGDGDDFVLDTGAFLIVTTGQIVSNDAGVLMNIYGTVNTSNAYGLDGAANTTISNTNNPTIHHTEATVDYKYNGTQSITAHHSYKNLIISGGGTKTVIGPLVVDSNLTISAGTLADGGNTITVKGNIINNATHSGTGKIMLSGGTGTHTISGGTSTFGNIELDDSYGATITGTGNTTVSGLTITNGTMTINSFTTSLNVGGATTIGNSVNPANLTIASTTGTKTFTGLVTVGSNGTWDNTANAPLTLRGGVTNNGTFNAGTGLHTFAATQNLNGNIEIPSISVSSSIILNNYGSLTCGTSLAGSGTLTQQNGATLYIGGSSGISTLTASTNSNLVEYTSLSSQTIKGTTYYNLSASGAGTKTLGTTTTINNNLIIGDATTLDISSYTLSVPGTTLINGTFYDGSTSGTNTFVGKVTVSSTGTWNIATNEAVEFRNGFEYNGVSFTPGSGVYSFTTNAQEISGNLSIPFVTVSGITLTNNDTLSVTNTLAGTGGTLTQALGATLNLPYLSTITNLNASAANNTVNYNGNGTQTIKAPTTSYYNLICSNSNVKTLGNNISVNGDITLSGTAILADGGYVITGASGKTFTLESGTSYTSTKTSAPCFPTNMNYNFNASSTVNINGAAHFTMTGMPTTYGNLSFGGGYSKTIPASTPLSVLGNLSLSSSTLADNGNTITIAGNFTSTSGTHSGSGKILLSGGSAPHTISGGSTSFGNLELNDVQGATMTGSGTTTISGNLILTNGTITVNSITTALNVTGTTTIGNSGSSANLTLANSTGTRTFTGLVTIGANGTWDNTANATATLRGGIANNGTFNSGSGAYTFNTNNQSLTGTNSITFGGDVVVGISTTLTNSNANISGITIYGNLTGAGSPSTFDNRGYLNYNGTAAPMGNYTFTANDASSTVNYNFGGAQAIKGTTYKNLILGNSGTKTLGANTTVNGTLTMAGTSDFSASTFSLIYATNAILEYKGSSTQTTGTEWLASGLNNVTINNSNGVLMSSNRQIEGTLAITSGDLDLNGQTITFGSNANLTETSGNTVKGLTGKMTTLVTALNAPNSVNLNNLGIEISTAANMGNTVVERHHYARQDGNGQNHFGILRWFNVIPTNNANLDATIVIHYDESELNGIPEDNLMLFKTEDGINWLMMPDAIVDIVANTITMAHIYEFSEWTIGDGEHPLPVNLLSFKAELNSEKTVDLFWETSSELNNDYFTLEKSNDAISWIVFKKVNGAGNSNVVLSYQEEDKLPFEGITYYRLKQTDYDGKFTYSKIIDVDKETIKTNMEVPYQNASNICVKLNNQQGLQLKVEIINLLGQIIYSNTLTAESESLILLINFEEFESGVYLINVNNGSENQTRKFYYQ